MRPTNPIACPIRLTLGLLVTGLLLIDAAPAYASSEQLVSGCWVDASGEQLVLEPSGSYRLSGDAGTWSAQVDSITLHPSSDLSLTWNLSLSDDQLRLVGPSIRGFDDGIAHDSPDPVTTRQFERRPASECGLSVASPLPTALVVPEGVEPVEGGLLLNDVENDEPLEVRPGSDDWVLVCELLEDVCQPVGPDELVYDGDATALTGEPGSRLRVWRPRGGSSDYRDDLQRLDNSLCTSDENRACYAREGFVMVLSDAEGGFSTGRAVLGDEHGADFESARVVPAAGETPALLWLETSSLMNGDGDFAAEAFVLQPGPTRPYFRSVAGPFQVGQQGVTIPQQLDSGDMESCTISVRNFPLWDPASGHTRLLTDVDLSLPEARYLELSWSTETNAFAGTTSLEAIAPPRREVCVRTGYDVP